MAKVSAGSMGMSSTIKSGCAFSSEVKGTFRGNVGEVFERSTAGKAGVRAMVAYDGVFDKVGTSRSGFVGKVTSPG